MDELNQEKREHLEEKLGILMSRWKIEEKQRSTFGINFPSHLQLALNNTEAEITEISKTLGIMPPFERLKPKIHTVQAVEPDPTPIDQQKLEDVFRTAYKLDKLDYGRLGTTREELEHKLELQSVYVALKVKERTFDRLMASANITELTSHQQKNLPRLLQHLDEWVRLEQERNHRPFETTEKMDEQLLHSIACKILTEANAENIRLASVIINEIKGSCPEKHQQVMSILQALSNMAVNSRSLAEIPGKARFHLFIGDAGAGKSTVCRYMALRCFEGVKNFQALKEYISTGEIPLPVYLRLEDFEKMVTADMDGLHCLLACAANFWQGSRLFNAGQLLYAISHQPVWLFLDGLDEISNPDHRLKLADIVHEIAQSFPQSRITLTSRPAAITNELLDKLGIPDFHILDLEQPQIKEFAHKYFAANLPNETEKERQKRAEEFLSALKSVSAAGRLASNPLLLTVIAVLHYKENKLPQNRAELYEKCIEQLMAQKAATSGLLDMERIPFRYPSVNPIIELSNNQIIRILRDLAFYAHQRIKDEMLLSPALLCQRLQESDLIPAEKKSLVDMEQMAIKLLDECDRSIGLLAFRGGHYVFAHRTFQEYLAARWLSGQREAVQKNQLQAMLKNPAHWQEVIRLFFNRLSNNGSEVGVELIEDINQLALSQKDKLLIVLSAQCLTDFEESQPRSTLHNKIKESLQQFRDKSHHQPQLFLACGDALGLMDEPHIDIADPPFVSFEPKEPFNMGSSINKEEQPIHPVKLSPYWLGKYPVTNKEFSEFIKSGGYENEEYWFDEESRFRFDGREFLEELNKDKEKAPRLWLDEQFGKGRQLAPVVGVSWYEAMAYCRWWTHAYGQQWAKKQGLNQGVIMRLPTEAEWEFAARGFEGREYPLGNTPEPGPERANYNDSKLGQTSSVGSYPQGKTPEGVWDMAGNVWEWCYDWYGNYEQELSENPVGSDEAGHRVLRGGSWNLNPHWLLGANRNWNNSQSWNNIIGFRCARAYP